MDVKNISFSFKSLDEQGIFTGTASSYGPEPDLQNDCISPGAFTKSLASSGGRYPLLWSHDPTQPCGVVEATDTPTGLRVVGKLALATQRGREAFELLKMRAISGLSIGFSATKTAWKDGARLLQAIDLFEVSLVVFPACQSALVDSVKARSGTQMVHDAQGRLRDPKTMTVDELGAAYVNCWQRIADAIERSEKQRGGR